MCFESSHLFGGFKSLVVSCIALRTHEEMAPGPPVRYKCTGYSPSLSIGWTRKTDICDILRLGPQSCSLLGLKVRLLVSLYIHTLSLSLSFLSVVLSRFPPPCNVGIMLINLLSVMCINIQFLK